MRKKIVLGVLLATLLCTGCNLKQELINSQDAEAPKNENSEVSNEGMSTKTGKKEKDEVIDSGVTVADLFIDDDTLHLHQSEYVEVESNIDNSAIYVSCDWSDGTLTWEDLCTMRDVGCTLLEQKLKEKGHDCKVRWDEVYDEDLQKFADDDPVFYKTDSETGVLTLTYKIYLQEKDEVNCYAFRCRVQHTVDGVQMLDYELR